ncbi:MAG: integrase family protein [Novosphingobium sp.]|nr:integrase family protein [Novosphingobium sp.]
MPATRRVLASIGKRAKIIPIPDQQLFIEHVADKRHGTRNIVISQCSFFAGLRAAEIAGLRWGMVLDAGGRVGDSIDIHHSIAKNGSGRRIPCHRKLRWSLKRLHLEQGKPLNGPVARSERGGHMAAGSVVNFFSLNYRELGLTGCSSHSGRRTFITMAARSLAKVGGSLRDVQELAGHRSLATTEGYIQGDRDIQRRLVGLL